MRLRVSKSPLNPSLHHCHKSLIHLNTFISMRSFPHETLPSEQLSLSEFTYMMQQASKTDDPMDLINAALCGRVIVDQQEHRVILNARQDLDHPDHPSFTRDFDSAIGITCNFPFTAALNIYPIPNFRDTLKRSNHIQGPILFNVCTFSISTLNHALLNNS